VVLLWSALVADYHGRIGRPCCFGGIGSISECTQYSSLTSTPRNRYGVFSTYRQLPDQPFQELLWRAAVTQRFGVRLVRQLCNHDVSATLG